MIFRRKKKQGPVCFICQKRKPAKNADICTQCFNGLQMR